MLSRTNRLILAALVFCLLVADRAQAAEPATVALTLTRPQDAADGQQGEKLLSLVELDLGADRSLAIVERRQIDLIVQEHVLDRSQRIDPQLQLGKLLTADYLAMLEFLPAEMGQPAGKLADKPTGKPTVRLRVVEAKTGAIRGVTVAPVDEATLEETAEQLADYVSAVIAAPSKPVVTVAVAPFESRGRFDRLRPLELGLRDLVSTRLLELSGASRPAAGQARANVAARGAPRFLVLARANMEQLVRELDLIRSGFSDKSPLPNELPGRGAAYLIRGEIDERETDRQRLLVVRGEMLNAQTRRSTAAFEFECLPAALEKRLAAEVDRLAGQLSENEKIGSLPTTAGQFEIESLKGATLADLHRMKRSRPPTREEPFFRLPGEEPFAGAPRIVNVDTPLGCYLLEKAINRLEVILFLSPDDVRAAYALGFCHSMHLPGIYRPERADELLRQVYSANPRSKQAALALEYLMQISFDDRTGELDAGGEAAALERIWFAFEHMPADARNPHWAEYLRLAGDLLVRQHDYEAIRELLVKTAPFAKQCDGPARTLLAFRLAELARSLAMVAKKRPDLRQQALDLLYGWGAGDDAELAIAANLHLLEMLAFDKNYLAAAEVAETAAGRIVDLQLEMRRDRRDYFLIQAGRNYRLAEEPAKALKLLLSFEVRVPRPGVMSQGLPELTGTRLCEIGACYEALDRRDEARTTYVQAAERNPSIINHPTYRDLNLWIDALGGYPKRADRDIEVRYAGGPKIDRVIRAGYNAERWILPGRCLATDGRKLYVGTDKELQAFDVAGEAWQPLTPPAQTITCLLVHQGQLWAGTDKDGLWQCNLGGGPWRAVAADQLPDRHVESIAAAGKEVYVGVGTGASGGLVRIDAAGQGHVFGGNLAPAVGPTHIVASDDILLARTPQLIHRWSFRDQSWSTVVDPRQPRLFAGTSAIWASGNGQELTRWGDSAAENQRFHAAWYQRENLKDYLLNYTTGTYVISFVAQHGNDVWFGGQPFVPYISSGVYRLNLKTGALRRFGPGDGFKNTGYHAVFDGLWLDDRLWLATSEGLCLVTPRAGASSAAQPSE